MDRIRNSITQNSRFNHLSDTRKESLASLVEFIAEVQKKCVVYGHGLWNTEDAKSILGRGLFTPRGDLSELAHPLRTPEQGLAEQITLWPYHGANHIVLIAIPRIAAEVGERPNVMPEEVFEAAEPPSDLPYRIKFPPEYNKRVPPSKIIGYWNNDESKFHRSPVWQESDEG